MGLASPLDALMEPRREIRAGKTSTGSDTQSNASDTTNPSQKWIWRSNDWCEGG